MGATVVIPEHGDRAEDSMRYPDNRKTAAAAHPHNQGENEMAIGNEFLVGNQGGNIVILNPPRKMTKEQALWFAAWIVALADSDGMFPGILEEVENT